jgi:hypothetical protein
MPNVSKAFSIVMVIVFVAIFERASGDAASRRA